MYKEEITHYSECLSREMHIMVYGHDGIPFLAFPTQDSLCHNYEDFGMIGELSGYLEAGTVFPLYRRRSNADHPGEDRRHASHDNRLQPRRESRRAHTAEKA